MFGKCRGCQAKDEEIRHLLALLTQAQDAANRAQGRLAEIASPGAERRMVVALSRPKREAPERPSPPKRLATFPGYPPESQQPPPPIDDGLGDEEPA
jgi:hypothetical protein